MKIRFHTIPAAPNMDQGIQVPYAPSKRQAFRLRWYLILLLVSSPLVYLLWQGVLPLLLIEAPAYIEMPTYQINSPQTGIVANLAVSENQHIQKEQPLLELNQPELETRLQTLRQRLSSPPMRTIIPSEPPAAVPIPPHSAEQLALLRESVSRYQSLFEAGAATRSELDMARLRLMEAEVQNQQALNRPNMVRRASALQPVVDKRDRRDWKIELDEAEAAKKNLLLRAPYDGTVVRIDTRPGLHVQSGQSLLTLQQDAKPRVIALLPVRYNDYAHSGQEAWVIWSSGEKVKARVLYNGTISESVPQALRSFGDQGQGILVKLELLSPVPDRLKVNNMAVRVNFPRTVVGSIAHVGK